MNNLLQELKSGLKINPELVSLSLEKFIQKYTDELEREGVILGLSGGIDSAVVAALCCRTLGKERVLALIMPEKESKKEHLEDALNLAREFDFKTRVIDITSYLEEMGIYKLFNFNRLPSWGGIRKEAIKRAYQFYRRKTGKTPFLNSLSGFKNKEYNSFLKRGNAYYRIKHRLRMILLYLYAELENRLVVGTANKTEYAIGYFVKHGCDDATDIMPLLHLYKTQVYELARYLKIPSFIMKKAPSPDIILGLNDEEVIGLSYEKLDLILCALDKKESIQNIAKILNLDEKMIFYVKNLREKSEHMRKIFIPKKIDLK
ncbi:MAG: NAD(+) synthase [Candidatus Caldatribacteriota bacterium]